LPKVGPSYNKALAPLILLCNVKLSSSIFIWNFASLDKINVYCKKQAFSLTPIKLFGWHFSTGYQQICCLICQTTVTTLSKQCHLAGATTLCITTLNKKRDTQHNNVQHNNTWNCYAECHYAECRYAECRGAI
jgi:hypothetical protein